MLETVLLVLHVIVAISLIAFILLQQGRGATTGAAFGSGASSTVFGARGSASFLSRTTSILAIVFFANCLLLAFLGGQRSGPKSVLEHLGEEPAAVTTSSDVPPVPAAPTTVAGDSGAAPATPAPADVPNAPAAGGGATDVPQIPASKPSP